MRIRQVSVTIKLHPNLLAQIDAAAARERLSRSDTIRALLTSAMRAPGEGRADGR